jgi:hypothetical protein
MGTEQTELGTIFKLKTVKGRLQGKILFALVFKLENLISPALREE